MNTELAQAWASVPGITELTAATQKLRTLAIGNTNAAANLADQLANDILNGGTLPQAAELGRMATAARQQAADAAAAKQVLSEAGMALAGHLDGARRAGAPTALQHLAGRLTTVLDQVRNLLPRLGRITDRDQVWNADDDTQTAWRDLEALATAYGQIRTAQAEITPILERNVPSTYGGTRPITTCLENGILEMAGLTNVGNFKTTTNIHGEVLPVKQPWPDVQFGRRYTGPYLLWLTRNADTARPWIPTTVEQITDALKQYENAVRAGKPAPAENDTTTSYESFV